MSAFTPRVLGTTGLPVGPLGLGSSYGVSGAGVERAFDHGVNFFLWGSLRKRDFARGVRRLGEKHREKMVIAIQTYTRVGFLMRFGVDRALKTLNTDYVDFLCLAWWNGAPWERIVDSAEKLKAQGKVKHIMLSGHHRPLFASLKDDARYRAFMIRYNAAHTGAEREVFPAFGEPETRPGVVAFTATRWGTLLAPRYTPPGEPTPRADDCYRFALSTPHVDVCLAGPKNDQELTEALTTLEKGPMAEDELAWMRRVGAHVRVATAKNARIAGMGLIDRLRCSTTPKQLSA